jgi:hypothetical protein
MVVEKALRTCHVRVTELLREMEDSERESWTGAASAGEADNW